MEFNTRPKWVVKFYEKFGSKLQGWYDRIDTLDLPPEIHAALKSICGILPDAVSLLLMKKITKYNKKYGAEATEKKLTEALTLIKKFTF